MNYDCIIPVRADSLQVTSLPFTRSPSAGILSPAFNNNTSPTFMFFIFHKICTYIYQHMFDIDFNIYSHYSHDLYIYIYNIYLYSYQQQSF